MKIDFQSCVLLQIPNTTVNGGIHTERKVGNRDRERNRIGSMGESEHESLLVHENTPKYTRNNQLNLCSEQGIYLFCTCSSSSSSDSSIY